MFQLLDGRTELYQWDINRKVSVSDPTVSEVHFCNKTDSCSLVVTVKSGVANIPNILLQTDFPIRVYAYCGEGYTKVEKVFKVHSRTKPSDYVYTETEVKNYNALVKRIDDIEKNGVSDARIEDAVVDYLEANPPEVNLDDYATVDYVDRAVSNVEVDLTGYATEGYVERAVSNVKVDLTGYATERYVDTAITNAQLGGDIDLSDYATKEYVDEAIENIEIEDIDLTNYATKKYVDDAVKDVEVDLTGVATEKYVDDAIKNVKVDTTGLATENWVKNQGYINSVPSEYVTESELVAKGYATNSSLSAYAKKSEIPTVPTKVSQLENDKGYLTEHIDISGKSDKGHTHAYSTLTGKPDLSVYAEKTTLDDYVTEQHFTDVVKSLEGDAVNAFYINLCEASESGSAEKQKAIDCIEAYKSGKTPPIYLSTTSGYDREWVPAELYAMSTTLYQITAHTFTPDSYDDTLCYLHEYKLTLTDRGTYWDISFNVEALEVAGKDYVDRVAGTGGGGGGSADLSNYYTKEEVDNAIAGVACNTYCFNPNDFEMAREGSPLNEHLTEFANKLANGEPVSLIIYNTNNERWLPAEFAMNTGKTGIYIQRMVSPTDINQLIVSQRYEFFFDHTDGKWYVAPDYSSNHQYHLIDKSYVDNLFSNIALAEGGSY